MLSLRKFGFIGSLIQVSDKDGKPLGTHGSAFMVGVPVDISSGTHLANIQIASKSGEIFSYI
jgi:hypothetical protein